MKIVNFGDTFRIFGDDLKTFDQLPAGTYKIDFHPMAGFSLMAKDNFENKESKIYGTHPEKIEKILKGYDKFNRSLGIILSGNKGMGKSLFVQLLGEAMVAKGLPVIMVDKPFPGVADFIDSIDQECLVIFDEFEKVFNNRKAEKNDNIESQEALLGLFDGTSQRKRMYAITVNDLFKVNEFMISRPGRFHYHLRFDYPTASEIEIYLSDKVDPSNHKEIKHVVAFASRVKINYDSLRAIAFELNEGYTFKSAIGDLNILSTDDQEYNLVISFNDGSTVTKRGLRINLFDEEVQWGDYRNGEWFSIAFNPHTIQNVGDVMTVTEDILLDYDKSDSDSVKIFKDLDVEKITISKYFDKGVNYKL